MKKIKYKITGLNLKKFLKTISDASIEIVEFQKIDYNLFYFTIKKKNEKDFLKFAKKYNYKVDEENISFFLKALRIIKYNLVFFVSAVIMTCFFLFSSNFVFKIQIVGLNSVSESEVLKVLEENGFEKGKLKSSFNLDSVEKILVSNLENISYASAVIKGNTLIVNVNEKIDNSEYIYNYSPIIAPFNCIINSIELLSGTPNFTNGQTVKQGEVVVSPYIVYKDSQKLPVPAKAKINAYVEISAFGEYEQSDYNNNFQKYIEEKEKELYNKLEGKYSFDNFEKQVLESPNEENCLLTVILKGNIYF